MNRKINLVLNESQNIKDLENIPLNNLDSIFSYSCELLICKYFHIIENSVAEKALEALFDKIRPQGQLILGFIDYRELCYDYIHKKINNETFFANIRNIYNYFNTEDIIKYAESLQNAIVIETKTDQYNTFITITKTKP
jgi:hypothetical protein